ncbi:MAG: hypothetical protein QM752_07915 [Gammaproteobacteria bacterium]
MENHTEVQHPVTDEKHIKKLEEAISNLDLSEIKRVSFLYSIDIVKFEQHGRNILTALLDNINGRIFSKMKPLLHKALDKLLTESSESAKIEADSSIKELVGYEHIGYETHLLFFLSPSNEGLEKRLTDYFEKNSKSEEAKNIITKMLQVIQSQYQKSLSEIESILTYFLEQGISLNGFSRYGYNPLTATMREKNIDLVRFFVLKGADLREAEPGKYSPLEKIIDVAEFDLFFAKKIFDIFLKEGNLKISDMKETDFALFKSNIMRQIKFYEDRPNQKYAYLNLIDFYENVVARKYHKDGSLSLFWQSAKKLASFKELPSGVMLPEDVVNAIKDAKPLATSKG